MHREDRHRRLVVLQQVLRWLRELRQMLLLRWEERQQVLQQWREVRVGRRLVRWLGMLRRRLVGRQMHRRMQELLHRRMLEVGTEARSLWVVSEEAWAVLEVGDRAVEVVGC